ncbi:MAG: hypothetical protein AB4352_11315 [Hormoscilla sp.]
MRRERTSPEVVTFRGYSRDLHHLRSGAIARADWLEQDDSPLSSP